MTTRQYKYGIGEGFGQEMTTVSLPVPETAEELARLFRRVPLEQYASLCVLAAKQTGGDIKRMAAYFYAMTVFPRLRARAQKKK